MKGNENTRETEMTNMCSKGLRGRRDRGKLNQTSKRKTGLRKTKFRRKRKHTSEREGMSNTVVGCKGKRGGCEGRAGVSQQRGPS